MLVAVTK